MLLPAPFGPITASDSPWTSLNETLRRAQNSRSPDPRLARFRNVSRRVFLRVSRRLYLTPTSRASIAAVGSAAATHGTGSQAHRTLANVGSIRLKKIVARTRRTSETTSRMPSAGQSGALGGNDDPSAVSVP